MLHVFAVLSGLSANRKLSRNGLRGSCPDWKREVGFSSPFSQLTASAFIGTDAGKRGHRGCSSFASVSVWLAASVGQSSYLQIRNDAPVPDPVLPALLIGNAAYST